MKTPGYSIAALLFALALPTAVFAQSTNVKTPNKNQSAKYKSIIVKGSGNLIVSNSMASFIGGGQSNSIIAKTTNVVIGGGFKNAAAGVFASIAGGAYNSVDGLAPAVGGGYYNAAYYDYATVGGGFANNATASFATASGGSNNLASGIFATASGGGGNMATYEYSAVGGGLSNASYGVASAVGGGQDNTAGGNFAAVAGGENNTAATNFTAIGGGFNNTASGFAATVAGGRGNLASASNSTVAGGIYNEASGDFSFAAGSSAKAKHANSFVWSDGSGSNSFESFTTNSFNIRASGGVRFDNDTSMFFGNVTRQMLNLYDQNYAIGVQTGAEYFRTGQRFYWYLNGAHTDAIGVPGPGGSVLMVLDTAGLTVNGTFVSASDRNVKQDIRPLDAKAVLQKVASLPVSEWSYKASPDARHYGPMAQDFRAAFGVGTDDKTISMVDADGVSLAAIKGLVEELKERDKAMVERDKTIEELKTELRAVKQRLDSLPPAP